MNENYPETLLNFGPLKCSRLGQKFIQYYWCLSQKKEFVKCSFIILFKCKPLVLLCCTIINLRNLHMTAPEGIVPCNDPLIWYHPSKRKKENNKQKK